LKNQTSSTPQALALKNHFGGPVVGSQYGCQNDKFAQYIEANPESFIPFKYNGKKKILNAIKFKHYPGYENKLNPDQLKSGDLTNIAPSASKIIIPEYAVSKVNVEAEVNYPAVVALPNFKGIKKRFHPVTVYDKELGAVGHGSVLINTPEMKYEKVVINIKHGHKESINIVMGKELRKIKIKFYMEIKLNFIKNN
jgi:hypothetical protein